MVDRRLLHFAQQETHLIRTLTQKVRSGTATDYEHNLLRARVAAKHGLSGTIPRIVRKHHLDHLISAASALENHSRSQKSG